MNKIILSIALCTLMVVGVGCAPATTEISNYDSITLAQYEQLVEEKNVTVIDVRTPEEVSQGKMVEDALELNFYATDFEEQLQQLDPNQTYVLYCRSGNRSATAVQQMKDLGFTEVYDIDGGVTAWK